MDTRSPITQFFADKNIFVTGGTGFLGRVLIEKLLRSCPDIGKIYMLVRSKKNKTPEERLKEYFEDPLYGPLKEQNQAPEKKIILMVGDCYLPDLGLDEASKGVITSEVNCIFHCAATVRFTEKLENATAINVRATVDLLKLAKRMVNLQAFVHVSTAYTFCPISTIQERMYKPGIKAEDLLHLVEMVDETRLEQMLPGLLGDWPNTYTFTKAAAEEYVYREGKNLPVVILRPSIINSTYEEPIHGWVNNLYALGGMMMACYLGVMRVIKDLPVLTEMVPVDYVANSIISSAWDVGIRKPEGIKSSESQVPIYNCCIPTEEQNITLNDGVEILHRISATMPSTRQVWHSFLVKTHNPRLLTILTFLLHTIPAYIMDFVSQLIGKKTSYVKLYKKLDDHMKTMTYFYSREWIFNTDKTYALFDRMTARDKQLFNFNMRKFNWDLFTYRFVHGARMCLLKESEDTIPAGLRKRVYLKIAHYALVTVFSLLIVGFLYLLVCLFSRCVS